MSEDNLKIKGQLDTANSVSALLPTGIIILKGSLQYSTEENNLSQGLCPCDGRSLNTYTYRNLHSVISNIYGGTAFSDGLTNVPTATTTFNVPNILNSFQLPANIPLDSCIGRGVGSNVDSVT
jgi:hypothetical protein